MGAAKKEYVCTMRTMWGIAKGKELGLTDDELHALVEGETGKQSLKQLTQKEVDSVCRILLERKDIAAGKALKKRRTDSGGNIVTMSLRRKIYALSGVLGWNDDNRRIRAFSKKITGVDTLEWLTIYQCNKVIEALKKMVHRNENEGEQGAGMG